MRHWHPSNHQGASAGGFRSFGDGQVRGGRGREDRAQVLCVRSLLGEVPEGQLRLCQEVVFHARMREDLWPVSKVLGRGPRERLQRDGHVVACKLYVAASRHVALSKKGPQTTWIRNLAQLTTGFLSFFFLFLLQAPTKTRALVFFSLGVRFCWNGCLGACKGRWDLGLALLRAARRTAQRPDEFSYGSLAGRWSTTLAAGGLGGAGELAPPPPFFLVEGAKKWGGFPGTVSLKKRTTKRVPSRNGSTCTSCWLFHGEIPLARGIDQR